jgi:hypothetical protein
MKKLHVITPVKDSIELTLETIRSVCSSGFRIPCTYTVYNDFSTPENTRRLQEAAVEYGFTLVNLAEWTEHPSPNYLLALQMAQEKALAEDAALCIVESDVVVQPGTLQRLFDGALLRPDCGIAAAVTTDEGGEINYPYLYAKGKGNHVSATRRHVSFCCSLLTVAFMKQYAFNRLDPSKAWHDVTISHQSLRLGFRNYLFTGIPVLHRPHSSRPWKQLKYTHPLKYYWLKMIHRRDKI